MTPVRTFLGVTRACIGIGAWVAPDLTTRAFGMDPERSNRFIGRLFGARELALAAGAPGRAARGGGPGRGDRRRHRLR